jgi:1,4-alpha-glucan branching enzyme
MTTKVTFRLPAEYVANASEGILLGEFNNWNHEDAVQLQKKEDGSMYAEIALTAGRTYQYRYFLNDGRWVNDNSSTTHSEVYGYSVENCIVEVPVTEKKKAAPKAAVTKKVAAPKVATVKVAAAKEAAPKATAKATAPKATAPKAAVSKAAVSKKKAV